MAGFLDNFGKNRNFLEIPKIFKSLSSFTSLKYEDQIQKRSMAVGATEQNFLQSGDKYDEETMFAWAMSDVTTKNYISFYDKGYKTKRDQLRKFSLNDEIVFILNIICDESIVYDNSNLFCNIDTNKLEGILNEKKSKGIIDDIHKNFQKVYSLFSMGDDNNGWQFLRQFLIDGILSFEIIYDKDAKDIIGFKELDSSTLRPGVEKDERGNMRKVWYQNEQDPKNKRTMPDSSIIYISYARGNFASRVSYVENLLRSFNLLRLMENTRLIWNLMNSTYRMKMVVPIGTKSRFQAQESLGKLLNKYKEDIYLDFDSGELSVNGKPNMQFYKNYIFPNKSGEQVDISTIAAEGPDLSNMDALKYFKDKLILASGIPPLRFQTESGGGKPELSAAYDNSEIQFSRFINRIRSNFQDLILKPVYIQTMLQHPELMEDDRIRSLLGVKYNQDNLYEKFKSMQIHLITKDYVNGMKEILESDGTTPYFDPEWLIERSFDFSREDLEQNRKMKKKNKKESEDSGKSADSGGKKSEEESGSAAPPPPPPPPA